MSHGFSVAIAEFAGPLETLLNLIEERKLSITDISLAQVTDAYILYVETLPELPLGETAQFILVASTLLLIKSRSLLPTFELSEDERESIEELERRLARLRVIRRAVHALEKEWEKSPLYFPLHRRERTPVFTPGAITLNAMRGTVQRLINMLPTPGKIAEAAVAPILALPDVIAQLRERLSSALHASFRELTRSRGRHETIVYFLAVLELARSGSVSVSQGELFSDITLEMEALITPKYGI
ncbi:MAG: Segregation and condensation protein A [Parcubacteria group bacterium GW2011_GWA2_51_10]|nr:MAG: Segregation and condensation protein A [Parcubacteria group bacterium GW2011_GWA2_51_10]